MSRRFTPLLLTLAVPGHAVADANGWLGRVVCPVP
jgi:hypothetical protein